jgi:threonine dehydrogenase-like Zn-dependent dehydrogenase
VADEIAVFTEPTAAALEIQQQVRLTSKDKVVVVDEISLVGSRRGPFTPALDALARGTVDPAPLIDGRFELGNGLAAFERAEQPGVLKVLVDC